MNTASPAAISQFIRRAFEGAESLPIAQQAELHEVAAILFNTHDAESRDLARSTAAALRLADEHQLKFAQLLRGL